MTSLDASYSSTSPEENLTLPEYAQYVVPGVDLPTLVLISHGYSPPLKPTPHLRFDVRSLPNPPKHIRDAYNGTSKRLQEWMLSDERFVTRRDAIKAEIEQKMSATTALHEKEDVLKLGALSRRRADGAVSTDRRASQEVEADERNSPTADVEDGTDSGEESMDDKSVSSSDGTSTLRVGIFCAMGRHRSVAMVEELAKQSWPGWEVQVEHRDLSKKRGSGKKSGGKSSRGTRGGAISTNIDDGFE